MNDLEKLEMLYLHCKDCYKTGQKDYIAVRSDGTRVEVVCENHEPAMLVVSFEPSEPVNVGSCPKCDDRESV
jgi:hypothetical protein